MPEIGKLSESLEDYLEVIYHLVQEKKVARVRDIANRKGVKMSSVVGALRRLSAAEYIQYRAREYVEMTEKGELLAQKLVARHEFLTGFLIDLLGVEAESAENEACSMEHVLSKSTIVRLRRLGRLSEENPDLSKRIKEINPPGEDLEEDTPLTA